MIERDLVTAKLVVLQDRISRARERCPPAADAFSENRDALDIVPFNLMLAVQSCLDIASHLIADEGWTAATTLAGSFVELHRRGVISRETSNSLGSAAGLRNVVAHGYAGIDLTKLFVAATQGLSDLERFSSEVAAWASRPTA